MNRSASARLRTRAAAGLLVAASAACAPAGGVAPDRSALAVADDPLGQPVRRIVYLDQGWDPATSQHTYFAPQGSELVPYRWFLALEQPGGRAPFRDDRHMARLRFLTQRPDDVNVDGLPVGFAREPRPDGDWLGWTCAVCHTAQIDYAGVGYRIDGGPAMTDLDTFLRELVEALEATRDDAAKFDRFAAEVLADDPQRDVGAPTTDDREALRRALDAVIRERDGYNQRNAPPGGGTSGYGRIDAFGAILNEILHQALPPEERASATANTAPADAPVSFPALWDTPQHDRVQWVGNAVNDPRMTSNLGRNSGQVLGVFGRFDVSAPMPPSGYPSSLNIPNLQRIEADVARLWSPRWPEAFLPLDAAKVAAGEALYARHCAGCHAPIDRTDPARRVTAKMVDVGTDPRVAANFWGRRARTGVLEGRALEPATSTGGAAVFGAEASGALVMRHVVAGIARPAAQAQARAAGRAPAPPDADVPAPTEPGTRYKARPLDGVWATAPYLHNGSVPTLYDLLLPPDQRPAAFAVGSRRFDPVRVGFETDGPGFPTFRTVDEDGRPVPGNANVGHVFGTELGEAERWALVEYLKSL